MTVKVAINGFGRIGRNVLRAALENNTESFEIVAINARSSDIGTKAHLFKYDSCYGVFPEQVKTEDDELVIGGRRIKDLTIGEASKLPWKELGVDIVIESSGVFNDRKNAEEHIKAGAKKVVITAPAKEEDITIVMGVNDNEYEPTKHHIISNASCTTNCLAPVAKVLDQRFGIDKAVMTTVHAYTNDQNVIDASHRDLRRARAAALSIIPTTTGAAKAVSLVLPQLKGKIDGMAVRVPTPTVSLVDLVAVLKRKAENEEEINQEFRRASDNELRGILYCSDEPLVSIDFKKSPYSSIVDGLSTKVVDENMVKVLAWYDNEWGYSCRVIDLVSYICRVGF
ncbi:MAG: NAD-dependent glyceraldehyde-3-phosphate dehydrogenase [Firmicutes bacterium]|nr:NAD-dependent glyceraldehyde-3-phosphate dehydrogenase [Bacillota bacterium]MDI6704963.1 type I glyceraldehyde-3-phosphate dehydrogenase [Bacillota bacterium]